MWTREEVTAPIGGDVAQEQTPGLPPEAPIRARSTCQMPDIHAIWMPLWKAELQEEKRE